MRPRRGGHSSKISSAERRPGPGVPLLQRGVLREPRRPGGGGHRAPAPRDRARGTAAGRWPGTTPTSTRSGTRAASPPSSATERRSPAGRRWLIHGLRFIAAGRTSQCLAPIPTRTAARRHGLSRSTSRITTRPEARARDWRLASRRTSRRLSRRATSSLGSRRKCRRISTRWNGSCWRSRFVRTRPRTRSRRVSSFSGGSS